LGLNTFVLVKVAFHFRKRLLLSFYPFRLSGRTLPFGWFGGKYGVFDYLLEKIVGIFLYLYFIARQKR
jgi:hypothetical protein